MTVSAATLELLLRAGLSGDALLDVVRSIESDNPAAPEKSISKGALRMRRMRERNASVTRDVTCDATGDAQSDAAPLSPDKSPLQPQKLTPTPSVCVAPTREADPVGVPVRSKLAANRLAIAALAAMVADAHLSITLDGAVAAWNGMAARAGLSTVKRLTSERRSRLRLRLAEHGPDAFTEAIAAVERSPFCRGESNGGWRADFDFLLQPKSFNRLIEGSYDRQPTQHRNDNHRVGPIRDTLVAACAADLARHGPC